MVDELMDDHAELKKRRDGSIVPGVAVMVLGGLALGIAAVEYSVFAGIAEPADGGIRMFGLSLGTAAYLAGYATAGAILIALGIWKIRSARPNG
jgi:hypothetical protein